MKCGFANPKTELTGKEKRKVLGSVFRHSAHDCIIECETKIEFICNTYVFICRFEVQTCPGKK